LLHPTALSLAQAQADPPDYVYLTWARDDTAQSINVSWKTDENYVGEVRYDTEPGAGDPEEYEMVAKGTGGITTRNFTGYIHHVELTGLEPDTVYYFIAGHPERGWSEERAFRTAPAERSSFRFVVGGDSRWDARFTHPDWPRARDTISKLMAQYSPSFAVFLGDFLWSGEDQTGPDTWDNWLRAMYEYWVTPEGLMIPIIPTIGNHEIVYPQPTDYDPQSHAMNYYALFNLPGNERWYSLSWGPDFKLIVLDSEILSVKSEAWKEQMDWLDEELAASGDYLWKAAAFHRDFVSARGIKFPQSHEWGLLFDIYNVDFVFMGHFHTYERSHPLNIPLSPNKPVSPENGTVYLVSGGWGAPLYTRTPEWTSAQGPVAQYHFVLFDVHENGTLRMQAIDIDENVFDELVLQKAAPAKAVQLPTVVIAGGILAACALGAVALYLRRK
jgi:hypothetical protein